MLKNENRTHDICMAKIGHNLLVINNFFYFFLYTLFWVMVNFNYGSVVVALYEAGHCSYGHHKFG